MIIPGYVYIERIDSSSLASDQQIIDTSKNLATTFHGRMSRGEEDFPILWHTDFVDIDAQKHVEKWVEKVGFHFQLYASRLLPPLTVPTPAIPSSIVKRTGRRVPVEKLQRKVISGDMSGTIGESLLASMFLVRYGLLPSAIVHLKATKHTGRSPDFYIRSITPELAEVLEPGRTTPIAPPLVAEAKGASKFYPPEIAAKMRSAFEQIEQIRTNYGLVAIFIRDARNMQYDALIIVVRP